MFKEVKQEQLLDAASRKLTWITSLSTYHCNVSLLPAHAGPVCTAIMLSLNANLTAVVAMSYHKHHNCKAVQVMGNAAQKSKQNAVMPNRSAK